MRDVERVRVDGLAVAAVVFPTAVDRVVEVVEADVFNVGFEVVLVVTEGDDADLETLVNVDEPRDNRLELSAAPVLPKHRLNVPTTNVKSRILFSSDFSLERLGRPEMLNRFALASTSFVSFAGAVAFTAVFSPVAK